jgi:Raf kinase inhibitor-like YbhB/YbcL family protein
MRLTSNLFEHLTPIPNICTSDKGNNISPSLRIAGIPVGTKSLTLVMHDPDAPNGDFVHWTMWNIPPTTYWIKENTIPKTAVLGLNDFGKVGYGGPCPPSGTHRYVFELYALNNLLDLPEGAKPEDLQKAIQSHVLEKTGLTGLVSASRAKA